MLGQEYKPAFWGVTAVIHMGNCVHLNEIKSIKLNNLLPSNFVWSSSDLRKFNFLWTVFSTYLKYVLQCVYIKALYTQKKKPVLSNPGFWGWIPNPTLVALTFFFYRGSEESRDLSHYSNTPRFFNSLLLKGVINKRDGTCKTTCWKCYFIKVRFKADRCTEYPCHYPRMLSFNQLKYKVSGFDMRHVKFLRLTSQGKEGLHLCGTFYSLISMEVQCDSTTAYIFEYGIEYIPLIKL